MRREPTAGRQHTAQEKGSELALSRGVKQPQDGKQSTREKAKGCGDWLDWLGLHGESFGRYELKTMKIMGSTIHWRSLYRI